MTSEVKISRTVTVPDKIKITRYKRLPELGPRILFFSGGTALKRLSKELIEYTYNSYHIITPFDSGGSSAVIRKAFDMISVGDLRNRLMALADQTVKGNPDIYRLFKYRFPKDEENRILFHRLYKMADGDDPLIYIIKQPMKSIICNHIRYFIENMPEDFNLKGANIGNLILAGGYINNNHNIDTILYIFSKLVEVRGTVRPVVYKPYHLTAELENGKILAGQHLITGKETPAIKSPIKNIYLTESLKKPKPAKVQISDNIKSLIRKAELICYPIGSFYSSLIANLIPEGIEEAVAGNNSPKIYIPNTLPDPEQKGLTLDTAVEKIFFYLKKDNRHIDNKDLLNFVLVDSKNGKYPFDLNLQRIKNMGIEVIDTELITEESFPYIDSEKLIKILLSLS